MAEACADTLFLCIVVFDLKNKSGTW